MNNINSFYLWRINNWEDINKWRKIKILQSIKNDLQATWLLIGLLKLSLMISKLVNVTVGIYRKNVEVTAWNLACMEEASRLIILSSSSFLQRYLEMLLQQYRFFSPSGRICGPILHASYSISQVLPLVTSVTWYFFFLFPMSRLSIISLLLLLLLTQKGIRDMYPKLGPTWLKVAKFWWLDALPDHPSPLYRLGTATNWALAEFLQGFISFYKYVTNYAWRRFDNQSLKWNFKFWSQIHNNFQFNECKICFKP